ncbi:MAG: hypothetical protein MI724_09470, partial [Spirochaetales bacterium]|nr:hypothetical protein [Spirochaetales bacterium]
FIQKDTTDYDMVMRLAERHGCTVWAADGTLHVSSEPIEAEEIIVEWEKTLIEFDATMDTSEIISQVEVRGWDNMVGEEVSGIADTSAITSITGEGEVGGAVVEEAFGPATVTVTDPKAVDQATAEELALDTITKNSYKLVTGSGRTEGKHSIKAGATIEVKELGGRFSGPYLVNEVTHRFVSSVGYTTSFSGTRNTI